jgi:hypothetical protein
MIGIEDSIARDTRQEQFHIALTIVATIYVGKTT